MQSKIDALIPVFKSFNVIDIIKEDKRHVRKVTRNKIAEPVNNHIGPKLGPHRFLFHKSSSDELKDNPTNILWGRNTIKNPTIQIKIS
jgi:hypothetical protein